LVIARLTDDIIPPPGAHLFDAVCFALASQPQEFRRRFFVLNVGGCVSLNGNHLALRLPTLAYVEKGRAKGKVVVQIR
jgi:hypothetical protein